jgi:hypothetical protein
VNIRLRPKLLALLAVGLAVLLGSRPAAADELSAGGISFSDELGGFVLEGLTGTGSLGDPFVVTERITDANGGDLVIRVNPLFGNEIGSQHAIGFALVKVVENATSFAWTSFELELQSIHGVPSDYGDGLSFGQGSNAGRPFSDEGFKDMAVTDEPYDRIELDRGKILIGGRATFRFVITETMPLATAFLAQRPRRPVANLGSGRNDRRVFALAAFEDRAGGPRLALLTLARKYRNS